MVLQILPKLSIIAGDLAKPNCGISAADQQKLMSEIQYVVHAAASIRFDNNIQTDLQLSYVATKALADLATGVGIPYRPILVTVSTGSQGLVKPKVPCCQAIYGSLANMARAAQTVNRDCLTMQFPCICHVTLSQSMCTASGDCEYMHAAMRSPASSLLKHCRDPHSLLFEPINEHTILCCMPLSLVTHKPCKACTVTS